MLLSFNPAVTQPANALINKNSSVKISHFSILFFLFLKCEIIVTEIIAAGWKSNGKTMAAWAEGLTITPSLPKINNKPDGMKYSNSRKTPKKSLLAPSIFQIIVKNRTNAK